MKDVSDYEDEKGNVDIDQTFTLYVSVIGAIFSVVVVAQILRASGMSPLEST